MQATLTSLFGTTHAMTWWQECARAVLIFAYGLLVLRLSRRRVFGKWSALDIVVSIIVGSNLSRALTGGAELWGTLAATAVLIVLHAVCAQLAARWQPLSRWIEGTPIVLAAGGRLDAAALRRQGISAADLDEALRSARLERIAQAGKIVLEPSGKISVLPEGSHSSG